MKRFVPSLPLLLVTLALLAERLSSQDKAPRTDSKNPCTPTC